MAFFGAVGGALLGGVVLVMVTKKPAMGILGMCLGAVIGGFLASQGF